MPTTVMLVEDNRLMREVLTYLVDQEPGLRLVATAADGASALTYAMHTRPHVVVMDVHLPGRDGVETTSELCQALPDVRVVMLSVSCSRRLVRTALAAGACGYLVKGGSPRALIAAIQSAAEGGRPLSPLARELLGQ